MQPLLLRLHVVVMLLLVALLAVLEAGVAAEPR